VRVEAGAPRDAAITEWTSERTKHEVTRIIAGAGVPCGAVLTTLELLHDPDLHKRGMMPWCWHVGRAADPFFGCRANWLKTGSEE